MLIDVKRPDYHGVEFWFHPDELDAEVPLPMVFATARNVGRVRDERLALCGYCLVRDLIGNNLAFEGVKVPAHLAAALKSDFEGHELFIGPITNRPRKIEVKCDEKIGVFQSAGEENVSSSRTVRVSNWELGFRYSSESELIGEMRTNARLWAGLVCSDPEPLVQTFCVLLISDTYGISEFRGVGAAGEPDSVGGNVRSLCREVGINVA